MENKYYTPTIDEFYIGFEYEMFEDFDTLPEKIWHKFTYGKSGTDNPENMTYPLGGSLENIRIKYLDREDIKSLGWKQSNFKGSECYKKNGMLLFWFGGRTVSIDHNDDDINTTVFRGQIKNRGELKKLMSQLGIDV